MILTGAQGSAHTHKKKKWSACWILQRSSLHAQLCITWFFLHTWCHFGNHIRVYDALYLHFGCWLELSQIQTDCWLLVLQFFYMNTRISVMHTLLKKGLHDFVRKGGELTAHASSKKNHDVKRENFPRKRKIKEKKKKPYRGASIFMRFSSSSLLCKSGWFSHHIQLQKNFMSGWMLLKRRVSSFTSMPSAFIWAIT